MIPSGTNDLPPWRISSEEQPKPAPAPQPSQSEVMAELRSMAANIRTCIKNGHPHMMTHLDNLLKKLGA